ncbi:UPF0602 protein C4orf47-like protein [Frankliniella fusca]|uniref:Cilia-and flagella-associated protein 96 n=1 Tax=Frankliniella fusca TaxID=407009 RepID=A0AAE1HJA2_9NEOP|nr:UPF0602 protein C4orf47-like protein [Frankliniella fusca]
MPKTARPTSSIGEHYGKRDIERIGIFAETGWLHGVPYVSPHGYEFRKGGTKGRQMLPGGGKTKVGLQDCYFDKGPFKRIFEKEAYSSAVRENYLASMASSKKNVSSTAFVAGAPGKKHSTPGDFYGTFSGIVRGMETKPTYKNITMSRQEKAQPRHRAELPNVKTNPAKKGTYGYVDTTLNKFPKHMSEPYLSRYGMAATNQRLMLDGPFVSTIYPTPCFNTNPWHVVKPASTYVRRSEAKPKYKGVVWVPPQFPKKQGNNHDGCFSKFPPHKPDKYIDPFKIMRGPLETNVFYPQIHQKSMYTSSIVNKNVDFRINAKNWRCFKAMSYAPN